MLRRAARSKRTHSQITPFSHSRTRYTIIIYTLFFHITTIVSLRSMEFNEPTRTPFIYLHTRIQYVDDGLFIFIISPDFVIRRDMCGYRSYYYLHIRRQRKATRVK